MGRRGRICPFAPTPSPGGKLPNPQCLQLICTLPPGQRWGSSQGLRSRPGTYVSFACLVGEGQSAGEGLLINLQAQVPHCLLQPGHGDPPGKGDRKHGWAGTGPSCPGGRVTLEPSAHSKPQIVLLRAQGQTLPTHGHRLAQCHLAQCHCPALQSEIHQPMHKESKLQGPAEPPPPLAPRDYNSQHTVHRP